MWSGHQVLLQTSCCYTDWRNEVSHLHDVTKSADSYRKTFWLKCEQCKDVLIITLSFAVSPLSSSTYLSPLSSSLSWLRLNTSHRLLLRRPALMWLSSGSSTSVSWILLNRGTEGTVKHTSPPQPTDFFSVAPTFRLLCTYVPAE